MNCPLEMVEEITHNTKIFTFKLPGASHMVIPTGHHIRIKGKDQEGIVIFVQGKFYTCFIGVCVHMVWLYLLLSKKLFHAMLVYIH